VSDFSGFGGEALFLLVVAYTTNETTAIIALTIAVGCSGFAISGKTTALCDWLLQLKKLFCLEQTVYVLIDPAGFNWFIALPVRGLLRAAKCPDFSDLS
jgi:hypothetical protein